MKTLYLTQSSENIVVDTDTDFVGKLVSEDRYSIRSVYYMEEPMHIVYNCGEIKEELDARKGDIVLVFYSNTYNKYHIDTIRTKQWAANIRNEHTMRQKEKEEWAARNLDPKCECCELCDNIAEAKPDVNTNTGKEAASKKKVSKKG